MAAVGSFKKQTSMLCWLWGPTHCLDQRPPASVSALRSWGQLAMQVSTFWALSRSTYCCLYSKGAATRRVPLSIFGMAEDWNLSAAQGIGQYWASSRISQRTQGDVFNAVGRSFSLQLCTAESVALELHGLSSAQ